MANRQMDEFQGRLQRIDKIHRRGGGFEAVGTLGRAEYRERRSFSIFRPLLLVFAVLLILKTALLMQIGVADYQERVDRLALGGDVERIGAFVMQADPVTVWLSERMIELLSVPG